VQETEETLCCAMILVFTFTGRMSISRHNVIRMHPGKRQQHAHVILLWWRLFLESDQENAVSQTNSNNAMKQLLDTASQSSVLIIVLTALVASP